MSISDKQAALCLLGLNNASFSNLDRTSRNVGERVPEQLTPNTSAGQSSRFGIGSSTNRNLSPEPAQSIAMIDTSRQQPEFDYESSDSPSCFYSSDDEGDQGEGDGGEGNQSEGNQGNRGEGDQGNQGEGDQGNQGEGDQGNQGEGDQGNQGEGNQGEGDQGEGDKGNQGEGDQGNQSEDTCKCRDTSCRKSMHYCSIGDHYKANALYSAFKTTPHQRKLSCDACLKIRRERRQRAKLNKQSKESAHTTQADQAALADQAVQADQPVQAVQPVVPSIVRQAKANQYQRQKMDEYREKIASMYKEWEIQREERRKQEERLCKEAKQRRKEARKRRKEAKRRKRKREKRERQARKESLYHSMVSLTQPAQPVQSVQPAQPTQPVEPVQPAQSAQSISPVQPTQSARIVEVPQMSEMVQNDDDHSRSLLSPPFNWPSLPPLNIPLVNSDVAPSHTESNGAVTSSTPIVVATSSLVADASDARSTSPMLEVEPLVMPDVNIACCDTDRVISSDSSPSPACIETPSLDSSGSVNELSSSSSESPHADATLMGALPELFTSANTYSDFSSSDDDVQIIERPVARPVAGPIAIAPESQVTNAAPSNAAPSNTAHGNPPPSNAAHARENQKGKKQSSIIYNGRVLRHRHVPKNSWSLKSNVEEDKLGFQYLVEYDLPTHDDVPTHGDGEKKSKKKKKKKEIKKSEEWVMVISREMYAAYWSAQCRSTTSMEPCKFPCCHRFFTSAEPPCFPCTKCVSNKPLSAYDVSDDFRWPECRECVRLKNEKREQARLAREYYKRYGHVTSRVQPSSSGKKRKRGHSSLVTETDVVIKRSRKQAQTKYDKLRAEGARFVGTAVNSDSSLYGAGLSRASRKRLRTPSPTALMPPPRTAPTRPRALPSASATTSSLLPSM